MFISNQISSNRINITAFSKEKSLSFWYYQVWNGDVFIVLTWAQQQQKVRTFNPHNEYSFFNKKKEANRWTVRMLFQRRYRGKMQTTE